MEASPFHAYGRYRPTMQVFRSLVFMLMLMHILNFPLSLTENTNLKTSRT